MRKSMRLLSLLLVLILCLSVLPLGAVAADGDGWQKQSDGTWFYLKDGEPVTGWVKSGDSWYYLTPAMVYDGFHEIDGDWYFFTSGGKMVTGWQWITDRYTDDNGNEVPFSYWAYFLSSGKQAIDGWQKINGLWYYFDDAGVMLSSGLYEIDSNYYYFLSGGAMATGWRKIPFAYDDGSVEDGWAYFQSNGAMKLNGWQWDGSHWYYFENGGYLSGGLYHLGNYYYYFNDSGAMHTGWKKLDGKWYYFQSSGRMKILGTLSINGSRYAFIDGVMVTNRWFGQSYFGSDGAMLANTSQYINGTYYTFGSNGAPSPHYVNFNDPYYFYTD